MLSAGMLEALALSTAVRRRGLLSGSPPPRRAAIVISRMILVKSLPRVASSAPFLCFMECHLECPDIDLAPGDWAAVDYHSHGGPVGRKGPRGMADRDRGRPALPGPAAVPPSHGLRRDRFRAGARD